jgi:hypothetical protein
MQQNLNPKGKKTQQEAASLKSAKWSRAGGIWAPAAASSFLGLLTLAHSCSLLLTARPQLKNPVQNVLDAVDGCNRREMAFTNFLAKKSPKHWTESWLMAGNEWSCLHSSSSF